MYIEALGPFGTMIAVQTLILLGPAFAAYFIESRDEDAAGRNANTASDAELYHLPTRVSDEPMREAA